MNQIFVVKFKNKFKPAIQILKENKIINKNKIMNFILS